MKLGMDLVRIKRVEELMRDQEAVKKVFNPTELTDNVERLAGFLAAKEAYFKARGEKLDWHEVEVAKKETGEPYIASDEKALLSITHEGEYAAATVVIKD